MIGPLTTFAANCDATFLGLKPWYAYLHDPGSCNINIDISNVHDWAKLWLIGIAMLEDLLIIAGIVAVGFVIYGGIKYILSRGEPDKTASAQSTIINAFVGVAISIVASAVVSFIGEQLGGASGGVLQIPFVDATNGSLFQKALSITFGIVGAVTVFIIAYGGFKFVTSRGEPQATASARNTIIYAVVGLVITLIAYSAVTFVVGKL